MDKCKFCQEELAEDSTVCPHCGKDNAEVSAQETETAETQQVTSQEETAEQEAQGHKEEPAKAEQENAESEKTEEESEEPAEEEKKEAPAEKGSKPGQIALAVGIVVVLAALLIGLIVMALGGRKDEAQETVPAETAAAAETETLPAETEEPTIPADGNPDDATCKGSYTADAEELKAASSEVVANMAEFQLTNSQLQIYYWKGIQAFMEGNPYAGYLVDVNKPLDMQPCPVAEGMTWQQFFLQEALNSWQNYQSMAAEAEANKMEQPPEVRDFIQNLPQQIEDQAKENGFQDGEEMLAANVGPGSNVNDYVQFMDVYQTGMAYYVHFLQVAQPDDEELETYYNEHQEVLEEGGITKNAKSVNVRHILITPEDAESEDSWKEAEKKAQDILASYEDGDKTEDAFAALAAEHSQDPGSQQSGGLYENVVLGQMVPEFEQWCFDDGRTVSDTGIVKTTYGYHIMFYSGDQLIWKDQVANVILNEKSDDLIERNIATYPMTADYSKILLGVPVVPESQG